MKHTLPKLMIVGHGRHGKDTVSEILRDKFGYTFRSSSDYCAEHVIFPILGPLYGYKDFTECFNDRHNHRKEWYDLIHEYCKEDNARLGKEIFSKYGIYCGLRHKAEFHSMRNQMVFDFAIWVDRSDHLPEEAETSMSIKPWMTDFIIDNNSDLAQLETNVDHLMQTLLKIWS